MRVLWLTYFTPPDLAQVLNRAPSQRGGWIPALADALVRRGQVDLAIATNVRHAVAGKERIGNVQYYVVPMPEHDVTGRYLPKSLVRAYQDVLADFQPDIIHVHGTESFHGLLTGRGHLVCPSVVSIQGVLDVCRTHYLDGIPFVKVLTSRTGRDWLRRDGLIEQRIKWDRRARWEREVFSTNSAFIGRTLWDEAHTRRLNPNAQYYRCNELLRPAFYTASWDIHRIKRHSVFASSASYPIKGFHVLVKAVALLRDEFPDITVRAPVAHFYPSLAGMHGWWKNCRRTGYAKYLTDLVRSKKLEKHVVFLPCQDAEMMVREFCRAHVFALPSVIENSPNALCEAMVLGTPSVVSYVGGVPSLIRDGESALAFPAGDEAVLAEQLRKLFLNDDLARQLSAGGREAAVRRHSPETIVKNMSTIYEEVISRFTSRGDTVRRYQADAGTDVHPQYVRV